MNYPGGESKPPSKRKENGDASSGSERPLKKARFAWQIKGKYHLRNEASESKPSTSSASPALPQTAVASTSKSKDIVGNTEKNLERLGDYLLKQDFNTLDVITDSEKTFLKPSTSLSSHSIPYPRYTGSYEAHNLCSSTSSAMSDVNNEPPVSVPMSLVVTANYQEDQCIARWQARQMAKGFVDNTINRVLDSWMVTPLPSETDYRFVGFDVADFINNLPSNNSIENEGILMAISAHGLQNNSSNVENSPNVEITEAKSSPKHVYPSPPSSPIQPGNDDFKNDPKKEYDANVSSSNDPEMSWSCRDDKIIDENSMTPMSLFPETSSSSYPCFSDTEPDPEQKPNLDNEENNNSLSNDFASFDFMDAAVSFAIQNRGLTPYDTEYG